MRQIGWGVVLAVVGLLGSVWAVSAQDESSEAKNQPLARHALSLLHKYCYRCHGEDGSDEGGIDYMLDVQRLVQRKKVIPGNPDNSRIWARLNNQEDPMPPEGEPRPTPAEIQVLRRWIQVGAPRPATTPVPGKRQPVSLARMLAHIHRHLSRLEEEDRPYQRYFVLIHLHNQPPERVSDQYLTLVRAGVSKVLNSLSWRAGIVVPKPLDAQGTVLAFDLRDVDWDPDPDQGRADLWVELTSRYPYALRHDLFPDHLRIQQMARDIYRWTGTDVPWVRADWFVAVASQPPLYHTLLYDAVFERFRHRRLIEVPLAGGSNSLEPAMQLQDLEALLGVNIRANLRRRRVARAGFTQSGVSSQPRLVERHATRFGALWISYDFAPGNPTDDVQSHPLGPPGVFDHDPQLRPLVFRHNGGEVIYHLPNGMYGYLLVLSDGRRINFGPPEIVGDSRKTIGNTLIVNGLSCMACHRQGLIRDFRDTVRFGARGLNSHARRIVRRLFLDPADMEKLIQRDQARYLQALEAAVGPFLRSGPEDRRPTEELPEPIGPVARRFLVQELDLEELAAELMIAPEKLRGAIEFSPAIKRQLAAVTKGGRIKRVAWEAGKGLSLFQRTASLLQQGTPVRVIAPRGR